MFKLKCDRRLSPNNNLLTMWNHDFVNINMYSCDDIVVKRVLNDYSNIIPDIGKNNIFFFQNFKFYVLQSSGEQLRIFLCWNILNHSPGVSKT